MCGACRPCRTKATPLDNGRIRLTLTGNSLTGSGGNGASALGEISRIRFGFSPDLELIEVVGGDLSIAKAVKQVVAKRRWQTRPLDLRHYSPNVNRASSSFKRFCSPVSDV